MSLTNDTIGGFNSFIEKQKNEPGDALLTTILFDDEYEILHNGVNLNEVQPMTKDQYWARGWTAMYDAIGKTINEVGHRLSETPEQYRPGKVVFVITTDGMENASREFTQAKVKEMIQHQTEKYSWDFIFLGANIDSVKTASDIGIKEEFAANYAYSDKGISSMYCSVDAAVSSLRSTGTVCASWADALAYTDEDSSISSAKVNAVLNSAHLL